MRIIQEQKGSLLFMDHHKEQKRKVLSVCTASNSTSVPRTQKVALELNKWPSPQPLASWIARLLSPPCLRDPPEGAHLGLVL